MRVFCALSGHTSRSIFRLALKGKSLRSVKMHLGMNPGAFLGLGALGELLSHSCCFCYGREIRNG